VKTVSPLAIYFLLFEKKVNKESKLLTRTGREVSTSLAGKSKPTGYRSELVANG
jgi:hypothetical protein